MTSWHEIVADARNACMRNIHAAKQTRTYMHACMHAVSGCLLKRCVLGLSVVMRSALGLHCAEPHLWLFAQALFFLIVAATFANIFGLSQSFSFAALVIKCCARLVYKCSPASFPLLCSFSHGLVHIHLHQYLAIAAKHRHTHTYRTSGGERDFPRHCPRRT